LKREGSSHRDKETASATNRLVDNTTFSKYSLKAFIPAFRVLRIGVIQDVPEEIDMESIHRHIVIAP